ncbi:hypothetical protein CTAYLR_006253 [Chrysophaeum taylorii]|uniref:EF-hand domain-containing protein n=1 Tax=Chrysophaeum taylorii TaxID=2483200 RepID=A0AAD7UHQ4_9STRA|nr:hypothetical protein CTAYLR_006253 [Chrysophaeum taylorii]
MAGLRRTTGLTKRKVKSERRRRRWQAFSRRRRRVAVEEGPHIATRLIPVCLRLRRSEGWSAPPGVKKHMICVSLSFFDCASRRFFGGTWVSRMVEPKAEFEELAYWCTRVDDPACVLVVELVACEVVEGRCAAQYGCGWTILRLFGEGSDTRVDAATDDENTKKFIACDVFDGTPRRLATAAEALGVTRSLPMPSARELAAAAGSSPACSIEYRLRRHDELSRVAHLLAEDEVVGANEMVPGLATGVLGRVERPPKLAASVVLEIRELRVKVRDRARLEQTLARYAGSKIVARRVAVGLHNGRALTLRDRADAVDGWKRMDLTRADGDVMAISEDATTELPGFARHRLVALVVALEYELESAKKRVFLGAQAYVPFDGRRLRLRTGRDLNYVELELEHPREDLAADALVFPPRDAAGDGDFEGLEGKNNLGHNTLVGLQLRARDGARNLDDETPDRDSDDSSSGDDESPYLDDNLEPAPSEDSSAVVDPYPRRPRHQSSTTRRRRGQHNIPADDDDSTSTSTPPPPERISPPPPRRETTETMMRAGLGSIRRETEERLWPSRSSLLARTLEAPIHRAEGGGVVAPRCDDNNNNNKVVVVVKNTATPLSRADRARLSRQGVANVDETPHPQSYDLSLEATDPLGRHEITIQFAALRKTSDDAQFPRSVYFTYQFYTHPPTRTERLRVLRGDELVAPLVRSRDEPGLALKYVVDTTNARPNEAEHLFEYLAKKTLRVDVWDAESRLGLGQLKVPLDGLLRQRAPVAKAAHEYPVLPIEASVDQHLIDGGLRTDRLDYLYVQVVMCNYGERGQRRDEKETTTVQDGKGDYSADDDDDDDDDVSGWRNKSLDAAERSKAMLTALQGRDSHGRPRNDAEALGALAKARQPKHRVRAKPLTTACETSSTLLAASRRPAVSTPEQQQQQQQQKQETAVTYDEVQQLVRRFRDEHGRVKYKGPLLALLEAPDARAVERRLMRVVKRAEESGTPLERVFGSFDTNRDGTVSLAELEEALRGLGCPAGAAAGLLRRFDADGDGRISLKEFVARVKRGERQKSSSSSPSLTAFEARVKAMLLKAEELGASVVDAFRQFDADDDGTLTEAEVGAAFRSLDQRLSASEVRKLFRHLDKDGSGGIEVSELLAFAGRDATDHLEMKLRVLLQAAERKGIAVADVFAAWDADGSGTLSRVELERGLKALSSTKGGGDRESFEALLNRLDADRSGEIQVEELYAFAKLDYAAFVEARLRQILVVAARDYDVSLDAVFREWDSDGSGTISAEELERGLLSLRPWGRLDEREVETLLRRIHVTTLREFVEFAGGDYSALVAERLRRVLARAETKGTSLDAAFAQWDADDSGEISRSELVQGLRALGFDDILEEEEDDGGGVIAERYALGDLYAFMGRDPVVVLEAKLRRVIHTSGISASEAFKHFDKNGDGAIAEPELAAGLRELPGFDGVSDAEARSLASLFGKETISVQDFERQVGTKATADAEAAALSSLREAMTRGGAKKKFATFRGLARAVKRRCPENLDGLTQVFRDVGAEPPGDEATLGILKLRFENSPKAFLAFCERAGVATPKEIAQSRGEPQLEAPSTPASAALALDKLRGLDADAFRVLDVDGSGALSADELREGLGLTKADARRVVEALDTDGNGAVDLDELLRFSSPPDDPSEKVAAKIRQVLRRKFSNSSSFRDYLNQQHRDVNLAAALDVATGLFRHVSRVDVEKVLPSTREALFDFLDGNKSSSSSIRRLDATKEKLRAILLRAEEMGTSLEECFGTLDENKDGTIAVPELRRGLERLGLDFDQVRDLCASFDGPIDLREFLRFVRGEEEEDEEEEEEKDEELVLPQYEFSLDPDARVVEKKVRRAARQLQARGVDVRALLAQYDPQDDGAIARSDFVHVLMQLGLSLLEVQPKILLGDECSTVRRRQLAQLARVRRGGAAAAPRPLVAPPLDYGNNNNDDELALVKWYREGAKRDMVKSMLRKAMVTTVTIHPSFGETAWFEHAVTNPLDHAERVLIEIETDVVLSQGTLRVITSSEEWARLRRLRSPACGDVGRKNIEPDMIDATGEVPNIMLMPAETVRVPFAFLLLEPPTPDARFGRDDKPFGSATARFVSAAGFAVSVLRVETRVHPCVVDRTLRFYQPEGEILKRAIRVAAPPRAARRRHHHRRGMLEAAIGPQIIDEEENGDDLFVHCVARGDTTDVSVTWRALDHGGGHEVLVKCDGVARFPAVGEFYVLLFRDRFCARLAELWHCVVHSRLRADANGLAGQSMGVDLVVNGDAAPRTVRAYCGDATGGPLEAFTTFDPPTHFRLVPRAHNKFAVHYRPTIPGSAKLHVHLVDVDTRDLVAAWLLTAVAASPAITKTYDVELPLDRPATKRIPYRNPWNKPKALALVSSDPALVRPRVHPAVHIPPNGLEYLRLYFAPITRPGLVQAFLYLNDAQTDQSEAVFLLRLLASSRQQQPCDA